MSAPDLETAKRKLADALAAYQWDDLVRLDGLMDEIEAPARRVGCTRCCCDRR